MDNEPNMVINMNMLTTITSYMTLACCWYILFVCSFVWMCL